MSTLQIKYATAPECKAVIDGVEKDIVILGNRGGNLLIRDKSDNSLYELHCPYGGGDCTIQMDVVWTDHVDPAPEPDPDPDPDPETPTDNTTPDMDATEGG